MLYETRVHLKQTYDDHTGLCQGLRAYCMTEFSCKQILLISQM